MSGATLGDGAGLVEPRVTVRPDDRTRNGVDLGGNGIDITECIGHHDDVAVGRLTDGGGLIAKVSVQVGPELKTITKKPFVLKLKIRRLHRHVDRLADFSIAGAGHCQREPVHTGFN